MTSTQMFEYIEIYTEYVHYPQSWTLTDKINSVFKALLLLEDSKLYVVPGNDNYMLLFQVYDMIEGHIDNNNLFSKENAHLIAWLHQFLLDISPEEILSWSYEESYVEKYNRYESVLKLVRVDLWIEKVKELADRVEDILRSFTYDYEEMQQRGKPLYMELTKYVCEPVRIERIAEKNNMQWNEYLDAIDL